MFVYPLKPGDFSETLSVNYGRPGTLEFMRSKLVNYGRLQVEDYRTGIYAFTFVLATKGVCGLGGCLRRPLMASRSVDGICHQKNRDFNPVPVQP